MRLVLGARFVINNLASIIIERQKIDASDPSNLVCSKQDFGVRPVAQRSRIDLGRRIRRPFSPTRHQPSSREHRLCTSA
jgi:hypothetical protein